jgi:hypothetical protein
MKISKTKPDIVSNEIVRRNLNKYCLILLCVAFIDVIVGYNIY